MNTGSAIEFGSMTFAYGDAAADLFNVDPSGLYVHRQRPTVWMRLARGAVLRLLSDIETGEPLSFGPRKLAPESEYRTKIFVAFLKGFLAFQEAGGSNA